MMLLYAWYGKIVKSKHTTINLLGLRLQFVDWNAFRFLFEEIFIRREYDFRFDAENPLIIDCGSNIGMSIIFFKLLYPKAKIVGFEPAKDTFKVLQHNVENNFSGVLIHNLAVAGTKGTKNFYYKSEKDDSLTKTILKERLENVSVLSYPVETVVLSDYIDGPVELVKIDVEGMEGEIIDDLIRHQKLKWIHRLIIEYHHFPKHTSVHFSDFIMKLEREGFSFIIAGEPFSGYLLHNLPPMQDVLIYATNNSIN